MGEYRGLGFRVEGFRVSFNKGTISVPIRGKKGCIGVLGCRV